MNILRTLTTRKGHNILATQGEQGENIPMPKRQVPKNSSRGGGGNAHQRAIAKAIPKEAQVPRIKDHPKENFAPKRDAAIAVVSWASGMFLSVYSQKAVWAALAIFIGSSFFVHWIYLSQNKFRIGPRALTVLRIVGAFVITGTVWLGYLDGQYREQRAALTRGDLRPSSESISSSPTNAALIELGDGGMIFSSNTFGNLFGIGPDAIRIRRENGKVLFSTAIRDESGKTVVEIKDNHWTVNSSQAISWDKNYDKNSLEVKNAEHRIVLQVKLMNDGVRLQGEWMNNHGVSVVLAENGKQNSATGILPMFLYPSDQHWAELSGNYKK